MRIQRSVMPAAMPCAWIMAVFMLAGVLTGCQESTHPDADTTQYSSVPELPVPVLNDWLGYADPVSGFTGKVPAGWARKVLSETSASIDWLDGDGHAVTFQSPMTSAEDRFSDYIMVELLPATPAEGFIADSPETHAVDIDGREALQERIVLKDFAVEGSTIDLVAYQLLSEELGYSLGVYVVGELREDEQLAEIFRIFRQHFGFPPNRLSVSLLEHAK